jgi:Lsr2
MAQRTIVLMTDDIDGQSEASQTVSFALDGTNYEIDLNDGHAGELRSTLEIYTRAGRRTAGRRRSSASSTARTTGRSATGDSPSADDIRTWARGNGHEVSGRGRIKQSVMQAYLAAH